MAVFLLAIVALVVFWDWNWFLPVIEAQASAAAGLPVRIERIEVAPGRITSVTAYQVRVGNPAGSQAPDLLAIPRLNLTFSPMVVLRSGHLVLRTVEADRPDLTIDQTGGETQAAFKPGGLSSTEAPEIAIRNGTLHVHISRLESDITATVSTSHTARGDSLTIEGSGTHAHQPITFHGDGSALLSLNDPEKPYPIDFELANGPTKISVKGQLQNPLAPRGADLNMTLAGPDMALLLPLTGITTPDTPPYHIAGRLQYRDGRVTLSEIDGRIGDSDLHGEISVDPRNARPLVTANLLSHQVDLKDLGGFVGATPGRTTTPGQTPAQVARLENAAASPKMLPTQPVSLAKLNATDVELTYKGEKIIGQKTPFDEIEAKMSIDSARIRVDPLRLRIGDGSLDGTIQLTPDNGQMDTNVAIKAKQVNLGRLLAVSGLGAGQGLIDGAATVKGRGTSVATVLAHGDGELRASMPRGGDVNSLLVDLMGLEGGNALLSAIGMPGKESITCANVDAVLRDGILASRKLEVQTTDHVITGGGRISLANEAMDVTVRTDSRHFSIGTLSSPLVITGTFKDPHVAPAPAALARAGAAAALAVLFPPAALLPTIHFGVTDDSPCAAGK